MPSDQRWTGGAANRGWNSGTRAEPAVDTDAITAAVAEYLDTCRTYRRTPSEKGCLTVVHHKGDAAKQAVIAAYRQQTGTAHA